MFSLFALDCAKIQSFVQRRRVRAALLIGGEVITAHGTGQDTKLQRLCQQCILTCDCSIEMCLLNQMNCCPAVCTQLGRDAMYLTRHTWVARGWGKFPCSLDPTSMHKYQVTCVLWLAAACMSCCIVNWTNHDVESLVLCLCWSSEIHWPICLAEVISEVSGNKVVKKLHFVFDHCWINVSCPKWDDQEVTCHSGHRWRNL